jgi:hypothetical protein
VFVRSGSIWTQQALLRPSNSDATAWFGAAVSLTGDGSTLLVGAPTDASCATNVGGEPNGNGCTKAGAAYVFSRASGGWTQQAYLKASNTGANDWFGLALSVASNGNMLAVSAPYEDGCGTGLEGNQSDNSCDGSGAVYLFSRAASSWIPAGYVKASNTSRSTLFGSSVSWNVAGGMLAVGAQYQASCATGTSSQTDTACAFAGAAYVYY